MTASQRVVICEGYHDRAFWKGWLKRRGCTPRDTDPWGQRVKGGQHGWHTPSGAFVRVLPARGDLRQVLRFVRLYLRNAPTEPVPLMIISTDADARPLAERRVDVLRNIKALVQPLALGEISADSGDLILGETRMVPLIWPCTLVEPAPGIPDCATLEQLVCGVLTRREETRGRQIRDFLKTAGEGAGWQRPADVGKSHAWAWMAHRQPVDECERFFEAPWEDDDLAADLEDAMGDDAARVIELLLA